MDESKAVEFDRIASEVYAPVYREIAGQIINKTGKRKGKCLDIGSGGGHQGLAVALITGLEVCLLDRSAKVLECAKEKIAYMNLENRVRTVQGEAENLPFEENTFDLVISRGSIDFWENRPKGLEEAYRVLKPGGYAYIGGGFGTVELRMRINSLNGVEEGSKKGTLKNPQWEESVWIYHNAVRQSKIKEFEFISDDAGIWIVFSKR